MGLLDGFPDKMMHIFVVHISDNVFIDLFLNLFHNAITDYFYIPGSFLEETQQGRRACKAMLIMIVFSESL